jgi:hypothetical protein
MAVKAMNRDGQSDLSLIEAIVILGIIKKDINKQRLFVYNR